MDREAGWQIPEVLFKYQTFTPASIGNLGSRQIWFSRPARFNDPFDCAIRVDRGPISDRDFERLYLHLRIGSDDPSAFDAHYAPSGSLNPAFREHIHKGLDTAFEERKRTMLDSRGVCCFSETSDDILMWSHYADNHKGFCLGFKTACNRSLERGALTTTPRSRPSIRPA